MSVKLSEALENEIITEELYDILHNKCRCGIDFEFNDSLKYITCSDANCKYNITTRINNMFKYFGYEIDTDSMYNIVNKLNIVTPFQILMLSDAYKAKLISSSDYSNIEKLLQYINNILSGEYFIYQLFEMCGIKTISKVALSLFDGFENTDELFEEIEVGQLGFINEHLGVKNNDSSIISLSIYNKILSLENEIILAESLLNIKKYDLQVIRIAFSDNVADFMNKAEFIEYLNYMYYNYKFMLVVTVSEKTDILIQNFNTFNNKNRSAKAINNKYVAESINLDKFTLEDVNKKLDNELKPLGNQVWVCTSKQLIEQLDTLEDNSDIDG